MANPFLKVKCPDCDNEQTVYSRAATQVACTVCGATLATPTGGAAVVKGEILKTYE